MSDNDWCRSMTVSIFFSHIFLRTILIITSSLTLLSKSLESSFFFQKNVSAKNIYGGQIQQNYSQTWTPFWGPIKEFHCIHDFCTTTSSQQKGGRCAHVLVYRQPSLYAVFLSAILHICDWELSLAFLYANSLYASLFLESLSLAYNEVHLFFEKN